MIQRFALLILCAAFLSAAYVILNEWRFEKLPTLEKTQEMWEEDMEAMADAHQLPAAWNSIREIEIIPGDQEAMTWLRKLQVPVVVDRKGDYKLEVIFLPWKEDGKQGVFLQYDLVDLKSKNNNTIFETNRTLILNGERNWLSHFNQTIENLLADHKPDVSPSPSISVKPSPAPPPPTGH